MKPNSPRPMRLVRTLLAVLTPQIGAGCAASPPRLAAGDPLPAAPTFFGAPVAVPDPRLGEDARGYAARALGALGKANGRLAVDRAFYRDVRTGFGGGK